jgi:hypothetical protein
LDKSNRQLHPLGADEARREPPDPPSPLPTLARHELAPLPPPKTAAPLSPLPQVIDAEMARRKLLEETPVPSTNEEAVIFDTSEIPWWAWVRRFHLPEVRERGGETAGGAGLGLRSRHTRRWGLLGGGHCMAGSQRGTHRPSLDPCLAPGAFGAA